MDRAELKEILEKTATVIGGKRSIPCAKAFLMAGEYSVPVAEIGDCCNDTGIKIISCQLGCF